jgi:hypothetical protein
VYEELNREFLFDFDPCPLGEAEHDGAAPLFTKWRGKRVFCNPPYNKAMIPFLQRAIEADVAVFLIPARTDTKWFHDIVLPNAAEIRFVKGRLKFGRRQKPCTIPKHDRHLSRRGFEECFRVLKPEGTLIFKWAETQFPVSEILSLTPERPLFGQRCGKTAKTHWVVFMKQ